MCVETSVGLESEIRLTAYDKISGGSRISPQMGAPTPGGGPKYDFAKISQKPHEIERIWTEGASKILLLRSATEDRCSTNELHRFGLLFF